MSTNLNANHFYLIAKQFCFLIFELLRTKKAVELYTKRILMKIKIQYAQKRRWWFRFVNYCFRDIVFGWSRFARWYTNVVFIAQRTLWTERCESVQSIYENSCSAGRRKRRCWQFYVSKFVQRFCVLLLSLPLHHRLQGNFRWYAWQWSTKRRKSNGRSFCYVFTDHSRSRNYRTTSRMAGTCLGHEHFGHLRANWIR